MNTLFEAATANELIKRIDKLTPYTHRKWGTMNVAQMLAHCSAGVEMASGKTQYPRVFIGRILGPFFKKKMMSDEPIKKNLPTQKEMIFTEAKHFNTEKQRLIAEINNFVVRGVQGVKEHSHPFFGSMTTQEWGMSACKHLDHHLQQFGV